MELSDAVDRILRHHIKLIVGVVLLAAAAAYALHLGDAPSYAATTRLVLDTADPPGQAASAAIADTGRAIATSPSEVARALQEVGVTRDVREVAEHHVSLAALGSSGVLGLTVTDTDPRVAAQLANALARGLIETRLEITSGRVAGTLTDLDAQIDRITRQILDADRRLDEVEGMIAAGASPDSLRALRAQLNELLDLRGLHAQRRLTLETERASILVSDALRPQASIVDPARPPEEAEPGRLLPDIALAMVLGLFLGIGTAAGAEALRPTVVGRGAISRETSAPALGALPAPPDRLLPTADVTAVASRLEMAASAARVDRVELIGLDPRQDLSDVVDLFRTSLRLVPAPAWSSVPVGAGEAPERPGWTQASQSTEPTLVLGPGEDPGVPSGNGHVRTGLALIGPEKVKKRDLDAVRDLVSITGLPVLGVVVYRPAGPFSRMRSTSKAGAAPVATRMGEAR
jgi:capsular polysaccharide biosynthesis protein